LIKEKILDTEELNFPLEEDASVYNFANSSGLSYEADHVYCCIREGRKESPIAPLETSLRIAKIMEEIRHQIGVVFPAQDNSPNKCCL
jgi:hypothetical protein